MSTLNFSKSQVEQMMRSFVFFMLVVVGLAHAETDVHIRLTTEGYARIRIAFVQPEGDTKGEPTDHYGTFMETLKRDLDISGYFDMVKDVDKDNPHAVVEVLAKEDREDLSFDVDLRDGTSGETIFRRRYGALPGQIAMIAHTASDDIVYALTGRTGIANTRMAFVAGEKGKSYLYTVHIDGSGLARLTETATIVMSPSWSPDATRMAYVSYEEGNPALFVIDTSDMRKTRFASFEGLNATPSWSPDGNRIALTLSKDGNPEIYVLSIDGRERKRITYFSGIDCSPTWAPNGLELAFTSDRAGSPQIFVTDLEGSNVRRITYEGNYNTSPAWSPQGDLIAYVARIDGRFQICTVDPFGITMRILTEEGNNEDPNWSPDGTHIVFSSTGRSNSSIYIMNRDGSGKRRIFEGLKNPRDPAWSSQPGYAKASQVEG